MSDKSVPKEDRKKIVMLGIHSEAMRGGIWAVVRVYKQAGLFSRWPIAYLGTATVGSAAEKLRVAAWALGKYAVLLVTNRVRLVHVHVSSYASFWRKSVFILLALAGRRPVILHIHSGRFSAFFEERGAIGRRFIRFILDHVTQIVVVSEEWRKRVSQLTANGRISAIPNPVEPDLLQMPIPTDRLSNVLLFLGSIQRDKGVFELLDAVEELLSLVPSIRVRFGGDGDLQGVRHRATEKGLSANVDFLGWVSGDEKRRVLMQSTLFVLPSYWEGMPMAVLEAMAAGLPIVTTRVGGLPDLVEHQVNGFLIEPGNREQLRDALLTLLRDPILRRRMGDASRQKVRDLYASDRVLTKIESLYAECGEWPAQTSEKDRATCGRSRLS